MARSGTFKSNLGKSGDFTQSFDVQIAGVVRKLHFDTFDLDERISGAPHVLRASVRIRGFTPIAGQEVKIWNGGIDVGIPIFGGHLMDVEQVGHRSAESPRFNLVANDYRWLLDRYARVTKTYYSQGVNTILADIIANYTNGGFIVGYCPMTLGDIARIQFTQVPVSEAISRLANAVGAIPVVDYYKRVSVFVTHVYSNNDMVLSGSGTDFWDFRPAEKLDQIRTRVVYEGGGSTANVAVTSGATTIGVDDTSWYSQSGGTVRSGTNLITYTGVSVGGGTGTLTGCSGIANDIAQGDAVNVYVTVNDTAAQTALAALLGGGASGIAVQYVADGRLSLAEITLRAQADLDFYSAALRRMTYTTTNQYVRVGRSVAVSITNPSIISGTWTVQGQRVTGRRKMDGTTSTLLFDRTVTLAQRQTQRTFVDTVAMLSEVIRTGA